MPRANTKSHFARQAAWDAPLLALPPAAAVVTTIREVGEKNGAVPMKQLAGLVSSDYGYLQELARRDDLTVTPADRSNVPTESALALVTQFLPRILGWKTLASLSEELNLHRNTIESMVTRFGKPEMLRLCRDSCLYISPEGETFVRERHQALEQLNQQELLTDFAKRLKLPLNHLTAFFSVRSSDFQFDINGRARISDTQKKLFLDSLERREQRKSKADMVIDGTLFRSAKRVGDEWASLFSRPGTARHTAFTAKAEHVVRHFGDKSGTARKTARGVYLPATVAASIMSSMSLEMAAKALDISKETLTSWRDRCKSLKPPSSPHMRQRGISVAGLIEVAHSRFQEDPTLAALANVPTFISSLLIHQTANNLGVSFSRVVEMLPITPEDRERLEERVGQLPRATHQLIAAILRPVTGQRVQVAVTEEALNRLSKNSTALQMTPTEFLQCTLSPSGAEKCVAGQPLPKVAAQRYGMLLQYALISPSRFKELRMTPAGTMTQLLNLWCDKEKVHISTALAVLELPRDETHVILHGKGEVTGAAVIKTLDLLHLSGDEARRRYPHKFANGPKYQEPATRATNLFSWGKNLQDSPVVHTKEDLLARLKGNGKDAPDLLEGCLSSALIASLITDVADHRKIAPHDVYAFTQELLRPHNFWPASYAEFTKIASEGVVPLRFALVVGKFLVEIADPQLRVHHFSLTRSIPDVGHLFTHSYMHDFGIIKALEKDDGGTKAVVEMVLARRRFLFNVR